MNDSIVLLFDTEQMPAAYGDHVLRELSVLRHGQLSDERPHAVWHGDVDARAAQYFANAYAQELADRRVWLLGNPMAASACVRTGRVYAVQIDDCGLFERLGAALVSGGIQGFVGSHNRTASAVQGAVYRNLSPAAVLHRGGLRRVFTYRVDANGMLPKSLTDAFPGREAALLNAVEW